MKLDGALLIHKPEGITSFGVIEALQREWTRRTGIRKRDLPSLGHGGTLDPFATGLLNVCVGRGVKLSRYFLNSDKIYEGVIRFGETTVPGDPTDPISERNSHLPSSREEVQAMATRLTLQTYLQTPPMHSAKKRDGKPLYELARQGIEVEREPKACQLYSFEILDYQAPHATFRVACSSGTYIRVLAQDLGRMLGTVAMLDKLHRTASGQFELSRAATLPQILETEIERLDQLPCFVPFDHLLDGFDSAEASDEEARALREGRQKVLPDLLQRARPSLLPKPVPLAPSKGVIVIKTSERIVAVASRTPEGSWGLDRVFCT